MYEPGPVDFEPGSVTWECDPIWPSHSTNVAAVAPRHIIPLQNDSRDQAREWYQNEAIDASGRPQDGCSAAATQRPASCSEVLANERAADGRSQAAIPGCASQQEPLLCRNAASSHAVQHAAGALPLLDDTYAADPRAAPQEHQNGPSKSHAEPPELFVCPITQELMHDPVTAADGFNYERKAMSRWLIAHDTSPMTGVQLPAAAPLVPNFALRAAILEFGSSRSRHL